MIDVFYAVSFMFIKMTIIYLVTQVVYPFTTFFCVRCLTP